MSSSSSSLEATATEIITRTLFQAPLAHIYSIPPLQSNKGHIAANWTSNPASEIFTARIQIIETSDPSSASNARSTSIKPQLSISIQLLDRTSNDLFAEAPYIHANVCEAAVDSSRFFALRVQGEGGRKAVLGLGFEERAEALDFSIALQEARKVLSLEMPGTPSTPSTPGTPGTPLIDSGRSNGQRLAGPAPGRGVGNSRSAPRVARPGPVIVEEVKTPVKRDWSLKEGQMLHVELAGKTGTSPGMSPGPGSATIEPPSGGGLKSAKGDAFMLLPPPPSAKDVREEQKAKRLSVGLTDAVGGQQGKSLQELGFDDGEFGEFQ